MAGPDIVLAEYRVDLRGRQLWRGADIVPLRPKPWALLLLLLERRGQVVTKDQIASAVWPDVVVGEDSITKAVRELRGALGDDARTPRFLETVHRVGLRFVADGAPPAADGNGTTTPAPAAGAASPSHAKASELTVPPPIGRSREIALLRERFVRARSGTRQTVFVTGEGGIGKSTVVRAFLEAAATAQDPPLVLYGQCAETLAAADAYGPLLDAIEIARHDSRLPWLDELVRSHAPEWWSRLPGNPPGETRSDSVHARMLREGIALLETLAADRTVLVVLEDAHAADRATTELVASLARRAGNARLLTVVTFRRPEASAAGHPVASVCAELELKGLASCLAMDPLHAADVEQLLRSRFGNFTEAKALVEPLLTRSGGNPLFLSALLDHLVSSEALVEQVEEGRWKLARAASELYEMVPDRLRVLLDSVVASLPAETVALLEAAAVCGPEFDSRAVAAALEHDAQEVEDVCDALSRDERLLRFCEESRWKDASLGARYAFTHQLYRTALYDRLSPSTRRRYHLRAAARLEAGAASDVSAIAAELATHYARGGADAKAVPWFLKAANRANDRGGHGDAALLLEEAIARMDQSPTDPQQAFRLLRALAVLSGTLSFDLGFVHPRVEAVVRRAKVIADGLDAAPMSFMLEFQIGTAGLMRSRIDVAEESLPKLQLLARRSGFQALEGVTHGFEGWTRFLAGRFEEARECFQRALAIDFGAAAFQGFGGLGSIPDLRAYSLNGIADSLAVLGETEAAAEAARALVAHADGARDVDRVTVFALAAFHHLVVGEDACAAELAEKALRIVEESGEGVPWDGVAELVAAIVSGDAVRVRRALEVYEGNGYRLSVAALRSMAAPRIAARGDLESARALANDAAWPGAPSVDPCWGAEQLRVRAELLAGSPGSAGDHAAAEKLLSAAIEIARRQKARLWEQRAERSLSELRAAAGGVASGGFRS